MSFSKWVIKLNDESRQKGWSYPQIFDALKAAGVQCYEVRVQKQQVIYYGLSETYLESSPHTGDLEISKTFNASLVQTAIKRNQDKSTNFLQFLQEIARAGVSSYQVNMATRTLTYVGKAGEQYIEEVALATLPTHSEK